MEQKPLCIVTGLSGAGKSTALRAFEDLNFFAVDGLPAALAPDMAAMLAKPAMRHFAGMAIGMDLRDADFLAAFQAALARLAREGRPVRVIFLEASDQELLRRYAATRRPHPLERCGFGLAGAVAEERKILGSLKDRADQLIDTSGYTIYDLRRLIHAHYGSGESESLRVVVISFGYKYGIPADADYVFDTRFLDNPFFVPDLRNLSGLDRAVADHVFRDGMADEFLRLLLPLLEFVLGRMAHDGRNRVTLALGCTGGRHRSVALAERLAADLRASGYTPLVEHRNIEDDGRVAKSAAKPGMVLK